MRCLAVVTCVLFGCSKGPPPVDVRPSAPPKPADSLIHIPPASMAFVKVEALGDAGLHGGLRLPAKIAFRENAYSRVSAPLAGRVVAVHVKSGDVVKVGAPLVTLDCPEAAAARAALTSAEAAVREARTSLAREQRMLAEGVGVERDRQAAERRLAEAEAELRRTKATRSFVGGGHGSVVILRSSLSGIVINRTASVGTAVQAGGEPLVEVGDPTKLWVIADVYERDLPLVREGQRARVELATITAPLEGRVAAVGAAVTAGLRTATVRITVDKMPSSLRAGMLGRATIEVGQTGLSIPSRAVVIHDGATVVYVEREAGAYERRSVQVGASSEGRVRVQSGLRDGERIIVEGALLVDGAAEQLL